MSVVVVGLNHRTVPLEVLERMTVSDSRLPKALADLTARDDVVEAIVLSTCMRTEIYVVADRFHGAVQDVRNFLSELSFCPPEAFSDHLYSFYEEAAVSHLFKVAAGLDSAVLGESEILGQVRSAWERAHEEQAAGPVLSELFRHAAEVGKRARSETGISRGVTSVSQAAVAMAATELGTLDGRRIVVLGAGDMGEGMAVALGRSAGVAEVLVANRTRSTAVALAKKVGGRAVDFGSLGAVLESEVDVLLTSTGSPDVLLEAADLDQIMAARGGRPLLVVDIAVPRDVDTAAGDIDGVTLLDMDDLRAFAEAGVAERRREVPRVQQIIADEVERYTSVATAREVAPLIVALRTQAEAVRLNELERQSNRLNGLDPKQREAVEVATRAIIAKLLHGPTVALKDAAGTVRGERLADAARTLFDL